MINSKVAMRVNSLFSILLPLMMIPFWNVQLQEGTAAPSEKIIVQHPTQGEALQGIIVISVEINLKEIVAAELSFSYVEDPRETWFIIQEIEGSEINNLSVEWDTSLITDGEYTLKISAASEQDQYVAYVLGLRVRNYTPIETNTPNPTIPQAQSSSIYKTKTPEAIRTRVPLTPTPLPPNPAQLTIGEVILSMGKGAAIAIGTLFLFGIYSFLRRRR